MTEPESGLQVCGIIFFAFYKGIKFLFIIKPGIVGLLCVFNGNKLKYMHTFSVWVWLLAW